MKDWPSVLTGLAKQRLLGAKARLRAALAHTDPPEVEQGLLRLSFGLVVLCGFPWFTESASLTPREFSVLIAIILYVLLGLAILIWMWHTGGVSPRRRIVGMMVDTAGITYFMAMMGAAGSVMFGLYLFVIFGNGYRYGRKYLHLCQGMMLAAYLWVMFFSDFWPQHLAIGTGFLAGMIVLPFYVGVLTDRLERAKSRADEANRAKGRFVANVSHEMRTPLNGVIAMADVLRETSLNDCQREIVETMTTSAELLLAQIEDVLDLSKIEANKVQLAMQPMDLGRLLASTAKVVLPQARYKGVAIKVEVEPEASRWFEGDSHHLRQVVLNLLSNAVKFTERGSVTLRARAGSTDSSKMLVRIEVEDTGIGISQDKQAAIFEPFTQADDSITRIYGGTGLGTTIARQLVTLMGGSIGLQSEPFVGSTFWIELELEPIDRPLESDAQEHDSRLARGDFATLSNVHKIRGARILVAEDNPTNQRVAQLILESAGHSLTIVSNGEAALDALESGSFDIALFDLSMPIVSGLEALKIYRFSTPHPIPVLILSANVTKETIAECKQAGAADFIAKPLRAVQLLRAVEHYIEETPSKTSGQMPEQVAPDQAPLLEVVDSPVVDKAVIADLARLSSDPQFVVRLVEGFFEDADRLSAEIIEAISGRRFELVRDLAHALKGGAASVGANRLHQFAVRLEKASHDSLRLKADSWIEEIASADRTSREALSAAVNMYRDPRASPISGT